MISPHFQLSGFADEISPDLDVQLTTMAELGVPGVDLRSIDGINVLDLADEALDRLEAGCRAHGLHIQAIGSPVNKLEYSPDGLAEEMRKLSRAMDIAARLGVQRIRIFSPTVPEGAGDSLDQPIMDQLRRLRDLAVDRDMILLHENDWVFWGAHPNNYRRMMEELYGDHFKGIYDFSNSVQVGYRTMRDWFPWVVPYLDTLHIKDALAKDGTVVPAGEGDGEMREALTYLVQQGWRGTLTLEPHLQSGGPYGGFAGPELFGVAVRAIKGLVAEVDPQ